MEINLDNLEPLNFPRLDLSRTISFVSPIQEQIEEYQREQMRIADDAYNSRKKMELAMENTAANTAESNIQLQRLVTQQSRHIELLEKQLSQQEEQLSILSKIFASSEDTLEVAEEIMSLLEEQIDDNHPMWEFVKDKGGDIAAAEIAKWIPRILTAFRVCLVSKGFNIF